MLHNKMQCKSQMSDDEIEVILVVPERVSKGLLFNYCNCLLFSLPLCYSSEERQKVKSTEVRVSLNIKNRSCLFNSPQLSLTACLPQYLTADLDTSLLYFTFPASISK